MVPEPGHGGRPVVPVGGHRRGRAAADHVRAVGARLGHPHRDRRALPRPEQARPRRQDGQAAGWKPELFTSDAPFKRDYPHLFSLRDGKVYGLGRDPEQQWLFDPVAETRKDLAPRPDNTPRNYGSAVPLPAGFKGPDSVLVLGGDRDDPNTYQLVGGKWSKEKARAFGRTQDNTLLMPDATLMTVNAPSTSATTATARTTPTRT